ncbi:unnamed protein product [Rotaria sp. Silwood2]|nr:unnamed protein product [Rotaria sp. Silwood2]CAF4028400.1 unnamed protein product [Rotaria sp. Silwood2]
MGCDCRSPINCYDDGTRYKTMFVFHTIDMIFFIIRLSLVSNDISKGTSDTKSFLIPILLFDLIASVPIIICDIIYVVMRHCVQPLVHGHSSYPCLWNFGTMTCIRIDCHHERPQTILLMRNADKFRDSRGEKGNDCKSNSLHHHLLYHTLESEHDIDLETLSNNEKKSFIAFYETTRQEALDIAQNGFPYGDTTNTGYKDYLHLKQSIFFIRSCKRGGSSPTEAIICVRLNLGRTLVITGDTNPNLNDYFGLGDGKCDTVYVKNTRRFYLRMPGQIEKWIITINTGVPVNDNLDGDFYVGCP